MSPGKRRESGLAPSRPATAGSRPSSRGSRRAWTPGFTDYVEEGLGDQAWWEQYGFKGALSEEKKRDYGNGVPNWSP